MTAPAVDAATTVAVCQVALAVGHPEENLARGLAAVERAAARGARVVVLPELLRSGYVFDSPAEARSLAEPLDGPTTTALTGVARRHGLVVAAGLAERADDGTLRNSAVLVDPTGLRTVYRKVHLWDRESEFFVPGDQPPQVVETDLGRLALVICYDLEFPEWMRLVGLAGADLVCAPTNWPGPRRGGGERPVEVVQVQAGAAANRMFVAACDRTGPERGVEWVAGSAVVGPDGYPLAEATADGSEQVVVANCRLGQARDKRGSARNHVHADRRPELYGPLVG
ncbi:nitrilase-related carbon-nitrogen hydrolase [Kineococcus rhizosphaerae]|uniref:Putative amidohydrolase n=1 Tax=Kineococcus rhizosphaerae TaxID=559628 RepID=A0A2T0QXF0_9ACTN|nr:nitrilase-related carbon-nitrogen hydrolase [Kineococcus rhizosphaerae]PRY10575.1 putative amidohydrolase [Kineococcus rhizosphaerae]